MLQNIQLNLQLDSDEANNGLEGIEKLKKKLCKCCCKPYRLVFVDLNMPLLGGYEMMKELKKLQQQGELLDYADTLFVVCTA